MRAVVVFIHIYNYRGQVIHSYLEGDPYLGFPAFPHPLRKIHVQ